MPCTLAPFRRKGLTLAQAHALRTIQAGAAITQSIAAKFSTSVSALCPHCGTSDETLEHRLHLCTRWATVRAAHLDGLAWPELLLSIPPGPRLTGVMPRDPALESLRLEREAAAVWPAPRALPSRVWTDGSGLQGSDPLVASAGWAVVGMANGQLTTLAGGLVLGRQTSARAELCALVWVSRCEGRTTMVTDNRAV